MSSRGGEYDYSFSSPTWNASARSLFRKPTLNASVPRILARFGTNSKKQFNSDSIRESWLDGIDQETTAFIEDGRLTSALRQRWIMIEGLNVLLIIYTIAISAIIYDQEFLDDTILTPAIRTLHIINSACTLLNVLLTMLSYQFYIDMERARQVILSRKTWSYATIIKLLLEICVILPHPNLLCRQTGITVYNEVFKIHYYLRANEVLIMLQVLKVHKLFWYLLYMSRYMTLSGQRVSVLNGVKPTVSFALRCIIRGNRFKFQIFFIAGTFLVTSYILQIAESALIRTPSDLTTKTLICFATYTASMWNLWETLAQIGYGDCVPATLTGRFVIMIICLWGVILTSLALVSINTLLEFTHLEAKSYVSIERLALKKKMETKSVEILKKFSRITKKLRRLKNSKQPTKFLFDDIQRALVDFRNSRRHLFVIECENVNPGEKFLRYCLTMSDEIQLYIHLQDQLLKLMNDLNLRLETLLPNSQQQGPDPPFLISPISQISSRPAIPTM